MTTTRTRLSDNTILITGGSSGIGRALAEAFHDLGNQVIVTGRRQPLIDDAPRRLSCTPGCNRCATSYAMSPWRYWSCHPPMCRPLSPARNRCPIRGPCRWMTT